MTDIQLLTVVVTLLAIFGAMISNRKSLEGMRSESKSRAAAGRIQRTELQTMLQATLFRIESKLDQIAETLARQSESLDRIARGGRE